MLSDDKSSILVVLIVCSTIVSIIGLILGAVSLSQGGPAQYNIYTQPAGSSSSSSSSASGDDKTYMIAIGHYDDNVEYLDPVSYQIKGYNVDIIDAVCDIANKNCEIVNDIYENCWDSQAGQRPRGGPGLMGGWYDACTGWVQTHDRQLTYAFTRPFHKQEVVALWVKNSNAPMYASGIDLTNKKVGFIDGWYSEEICLARYATAATNPITGANLEAERIIHIQTPSGLATALENGDVDLAFVSRNLPQFSSRFTAITSASWPNLCEIDGQSMMTTKRNSEFIRWWDDALNRLLPTKRYQDICENIMREHGGIPGGTPAETCIGY